MQRNIHKKYSNDDLNNGSINNNEIDLVAKNDDLIPLSALSKQDEKNQANPKSLDYIAGIRLIERWIVSALKSYAAKDNYKETEWWGDNLSAHIRNLGIVIGKKYVDDSGAIVASYRVDWDPIKGSHFNINLSINKMDKSTDKYVFKFGDPHRISESKRIFMIYSRMTADALGLGAIMPPEIAEKFMRHKAMNDSSVEEYFKLFEEELINRLSKTASDVIRHNDQENNLKQKEIGDNQINFQQEGEKKCHDLLMTIANSPSDSVSKYRQKRNQSDTSQQSFFASTLSFFLSPFDDCLRIFNQDNHHKRGRGRRR